jgi:putative flavoprotein involved in K+ transport
MRPQRLLGRDLFWWLTHLGLMRVPAESRLGRRVQARGEFIIGTSRRRLRRAGVAFRPRLVGAQGRTVRFADGGTLEGLYFLGLSWQHTRGSALLGFIDDDASHIADRIAADRTATASGEASTAPEASG